MNNTPSSYDTMKTFALLSQLGLVMVVTVILFTLCGLYLGKWLNLQTPFTLGGLLLGIGSGFWNAYRKLVRFIPPPE